MYIIQIASECAPVAKVGGLGVLDCGGKRSATPLWGGACQSKSGVAAALCHRSPRFHLLDTAVEKMQKA
jgi:hypothetical protein